MKIQVMQCVLTILPLILIQKIYNHVRKIAKSESLKELSEGRIPIHFLYKFDNKVVL